MPAGPPNHWSRLTALLLGAYWLTLAIGTHLPVVPGPPVTYNDKLLHFMAYAGLTFLLAGYWTTRRVFGLRGLLLAFGIAIAYGALDELTQLLVPGREGDWRDWLADVAGAAAGACLFGALDSVRRSLGRDRGSAAEA